MNSLNDILTQKADDLFADNSQTLNDAADNNTEIIDNKKLESVNLEQLKKAVYNLKDQVDNIIRILNIEQTKKLEIKNPEKQILLGGENIIEGVFNGQAMIGADGKEYTIPANYAIKSKLVEGDLMKLTITNNGNFIFKQISQIERKRLTGEVISNFENNQWSVLAEGKTYKVLTASVTFFRGKSGDQAVILVPADGNSEWAAIENIIPT